MNNEIAKLDADWRDTLKKLSDQMAEERDLIAICAKARERFNIIESEIAAAEAQIIAENTGKDLPISGSNEATRKSQAVAYLKKVRAVEGSVLWKLDREYCDAMNELRDREAEREALKDAIEISRLTLSHLDALLRVIGLP